MENNESRLQNALQALQEWTGSQVDPTTHPYVKDKSFYDKIVNAPFENSKMAAYRDSLANLDLLKTANNIMPRNREHLTSISQGLIKQSADVAEQDSNIRNEMTRRNTISEALQGMQGIRNPIEALAALKTLKATTGMDYNPAEVTSMLGSKESYDAKKMQGLLSLVNVFSGLRGQDMQMAMQNKQLAMQEKIASMRGAGGYGGRGGIDFNPKDAISAIGDVNAALKLIRDEQDPAKRMDAVNDLIQKAPSYALMNPGLDYQIYSRIANIFPEDFEVDESGNITPKTKSGKREATSTSVEDILNGASTGDPELDELIRGLNLSPSSNDGSNKQYVTLPNGRKSEYIDLNPKIAAWKEKVSSTYGGNYDPYYNRKTYP